MCKEAARGTRSVFINASRQRVQKQQQQQPRRMQENDWAQNLAHGINAQIVGTCRTQEEL